MKTLISIIILVAVVAGGWYLYSKGQQQSAVAPTGALGTNGSPNQGNLGQPDNGTPQQPQTQAQPVLATASDAKLGTLITAQNGMTLYTFDKDTPGVSNCSGVCAANWPPYTVADSANLPVVAGITGTVATLTRADGTLQVTYNGRPLYFYIKDKAVGDTTGDGVGGTWHVAKP